MKREPPLTGKTRFQSQSYPRAGVDPPTLPPRRLAPGLRRLPKPRFASDASSPHAGAARLAAAASHRDDGPRSPPHSSGQGLSLPPPPPGQSGGGQLPAPLTCCWIFPSSVTTQWVVAAAGRVPEASSEHRPRAQPEKTHARPSPPRPDAAAAAIFPNPGLPAPPGNGIAAAAILGRGEAGGRHRLS